MESVWSTHKQHVSSLPEFLSSNPHVWMEWDDLIVSRSTARRSGWLHRLIGSLSTDKSAHLVSCLFGAFSPRVARTFEESYQDLRSFRIRRMRGKSGALKRLLVVVYWVGLLWLALSTAIVSIKSGLFRVILPRRGK